MGAYDDILEGKPKQAKRGAYDDILEGESTAQAIHQQDKDIIGGLVRSGTGVVSNLMRPFEAMIPGGNDFSSGHQERMGRVEDRLKRKGYDQQSKSFQGAKLLGDVGITAPVGGALAKLVPLVSKAPAATKFANALRTGGFSTGAPKATTLGGKAADMAIRSGAGGITGGAMTALVDPESAGTGAVIGAALPPAISGVGKLSHGVGGAVKRAWLPSKSVLAKSILEVADARTPQEIAALRAQLNPVGPSILPDSVPTVPQLLQRPGVSQLQRTVKSAGDTQLLEREAAQNAARFRGLDRISPVSGTVQQSAENFGNTLEKFAFPAKAAAKARVSALYDDPVLSDARILLPIDEMRAAKSKYMGAGTFGAGGAADKAIDTAVDVSTMKAANKMPKHGRVSSLLDDIRAMGGIEKSNIKDITGESRVGKGMNGLPPNLFTGRGAQLDDLTGRLRARGYDIPDDVDGGVQALRDMIGEEINGNKVYSLHNMEAAAEATSKARYAPAPQKPTAQAVPFKTLQNLRSSIGDAAQEAKLGSRNQESAALQSMRSAIDDKVDNVVEYGGQHGETFSPEAMSAWLKANLAHKERIARFDTGPQAAMFKTGSDGVPVSQGAELAGRFFNSARSQADDARAFNRLIAGDKGSADALKNYAVTDAANQTRGGGVLSSPKFSKWVDARSGAIRETFSPQDRAMIEAVRRDLLASDMAENLGRASGSNTVQNAQNALRHGILEHPATDVIANKIPLLNQVTGPMLKALRENAQKSKAIELGGLLSNPADLDMAIGRYLQTLKPSEINLLLNRAGPGLLRAAPVVAVDQ